MSDLDLLLLLNSSEADDRKKAVLKIGELKMKEAVPDLIIRLQTDEDNVVRNNAARALGKIADPDQQDIILEALIGALNDSDYNVKTNICWSLGKLKDPRAVPELIKYTQASMHFYTTTGNGKTGDANIIMQADLKEQGVLYSDIIVKAIEALGEIGDQSCIPALIEALKDPQDGTVRCAAALALGKLGSSDAVPALIEALNDQYWYCRRDAAKALMLLKAEEAIDSLVGKLSDMMDEVKEYAIKALIAIGQPAAKHLFSAFLKQPKNTLLKDFVEKQLSREDIWGFLTELIENETDPAKKELYEKYLSQFQGN